MTIEPPPPLTLPKLSLDHVSRFAAAAGLTITQAGPDRVTGWIELGPEHHTPWGVVHGGVYTTAVESAASIGASAAVADRGQIAVGVHNATDFLRPATSGRAEVVAEPIHQGRIQQLWQVIITQQSDGKELARGQLRVQMSRRRPDRWREIVNTCGSVMAMPPRFRRVVRRVGR